MAGTRWSVTHVEVSVFEPWVEADLWRATRAGAQVCSCRTSSVTRIGSNRIRREQPRNHSRISKYDALGSENRAHDDSRKTIRKNVNVGWRREWETSRTDRATRTATSLSGSSTTLHATSRFRLFSSVSWHLRRS